MMFLPFLKVIQISFYTIQVNDYQMIKAVVFSLILVLASTCENRTAVIARGMEWVKANVPYNASAYHGGYVQGCEGIVGYAWLFPKPGVYSGDLMTQGWCKKVTKADLLAGDILVCPGHHQLLFDGWANTDKSMYWAIELGGSKGSIRYQIPWPYWADYNPTCYVPCKVQKACLPYQPLLQTQ